MRATSGRAFVAGFISTLVFHQGVLLLLFLAGIAPKAPFDFSPVAPFGIPSLLSLAFFGGLWGVAIWLLVRKQPGKKLWLRSMILGAIGPTALAFLVVAPLKGVEVKAIIIPFGLMLNGVWGLGVVVLMKLIGEKFHSHTHS